MDCLLDWLFLFNFARFPFKFLWVTENLKNSQKFANQKINYSRHFTNTLDINFFYFNCYFLFSSNNSHSNLINLPYFSTLGMNSFFLHYNRHHLLFHLGIILKNLLNSNFMVQPHQNLKLKKTFS